MYWSVTFLMVVAGGGLAAIYFGDSADALVAFHVGVSAPLLVQKLSTTMAQPGARRADPEGVVDFFSW